MLTFVFHVSSLVTKRIGRLEPLHVRERDRRRGKSLHRPASSNPASEMDPPAGSGESTADYENRIRRQICTFPNRLHNSWMNATLQAMLNLTVVQDKLRHQPIAPLTQLSVMPSFARLFLRALKNPGKNIRYVYGSLVELGQVVPRITAFQENNPLDLLGPFLLWLGECGLQTNITETKIIKCKNCEFTYCSSWSLSRIYFLPVPSKDEESVSSLVTSAFTKRLCRKRCPDCDSEKEKAFFWNSPDILTISRAPQITDSPEIRHPVAPNMFLKICVDEDKTEVYKLSSVICYSAAKTHYWARLFRDHRTIEADDSSIRVLPSDDSEDLTDEEIFFYEKMLIPAR